jgi:hypothetical protein
MYWILPVMVCGIFLHCGGGSGNETGQIYFEVNDSLLAPCYHDTVHNFVLCPPKDCKAVPESDLAEAKKQIELVHDANKLFSYELLRFFADTLSGAVCSITRISYSLENKEEFTNVYYSALNEKYPRGRINKASYKIGDLPVEQFLITTDSKVNFKIIFQTHDWSTIQIDYAVARSVYPEFIKRIESSIGSIMVSIKT